MKTILLIDDSRFDRLIHRRWLEGICPSEFRVLEAEDAELGLQIAREEIVDCVLLDYVMLREDGLQTIRLFKSELPSCPAIILLTCALTEDMKRNAIALGAADCFIKPLSTGEPLIAAMKKAIAARECAEGTPKGLAP